MNTGIAIELPPGTHDMVPNLEFSYNSSAGNRILGAGWSLTGFHFITRNPSYGINFTPSISKRLIIKESQFFFDLSHSLVR